MIKWINTNIAITYSAFDIHDVQNLRPKESGNVRKRNPCKKICIVLFPMELTKIYPIDRSAYFFFVFFSAVVEKIIQISMLFVLPFL